MNIIKKFNKIFNILMNDKRNNILLLELQELQILNLIKLELLLNIIKGIIFSLYIDYNKIDKYIIILKSIHLNHEDNKLFFDYFNNLNFSKQFNYNENKINNILTQMDVYFCNNYKNKKIFEIQYLIIKEINNLKINLDVKIDLYIIILKYINNKPFKNNSNLLKKNLIEMFDNINLFIK